MARRRIAHQYPFRRRLDRQWVALRIARGMPVDEVAYIERAEVGAVHALVQDRRLQRLIGAWKEHVAGTEEERLERLTRLALDVLDLAIGNGDRRAAAFFLAERTAGRHPGRTLAKAVEATLSRAGDPGYQRPVGERVRPAPEPAPPPDPDAVAEAGSDPAIQDEAATAHTRRSLARTRLALKRRLMEEAARAATAQPASQAHAAPADWIETLLADPAAPLPPRPAPTPATRARRAVTGAVHAYAIARIGRHLRAAAEDDRLIDVIGPRPGREVLDAWLRLG